jgi:putative transposase
MARLARLVVPEGAHHVVARGVNRTRIFRSGFDKRRYQKKFAILADEEEVIVHAYALMDNHVHFLLSPKHPDGLARFFLRLHTWWACYFNLHSDRTGHLFEGRFRSSPVDEVHFWTAMRYIELNPKRAGLTADLAAWEFSSARAHLAGTEDPFVKLAMDAVSRRGWTAVHWESFLEESDHEKEANLVKCLRNSRPCGNEHWRETLKRYGKGLPRLSHMDNTQGDSGKAR